MYRRQRFTSTPPQRLTSPPLKTRGLFAFGTEKSLVATSPHDRVPHRPRKNQQEEHPRSGKSIRAVGLPRAIWLSPAGHPGLHKVTCTRDLLPRASEPARRRTGHRAGRASGRGYADAAGRFRRDCRLEPVSSETRLNPSAEHTRQRTRHIARSRLKNAMDARIVVGQVRHRVSVSPGLAANRNADYTRAPKLSRA